MVSCGTQKAGLGLEWDLLCCGNKRAWHWLCKDRNITDTADNEGKPGGGMDVASVVFNTTHGIPKYFCLSSFWCWISQAAQWFALVTLFGLGSDLSGVSLIFLPLASVGGKSEKPEQGRSRLTCPGCSPASHLPTDEIGCPFSLTLVSNLT